MLLHKNLRLVMFFLCVGFISSIMVKNVYADGVEKGVYEYVIQKCEMRFDEASDALEQAIENSSFEFVKKYDQAATKGCSYKARVFIFYDGDYVKQIVAINNKTGPFAIVDRINLFEDENGLHVSIVNPTNINRTILLDDKQYNELSEGHRLSLRTLITEALPGSVSEKQYGPIRKKGKIGKTMGIMAGGPFDKKVTNVLVVPAESVADAIGELEEVMRNNDGKWGLTPVYSIALEEEGVGVLGVSSAAIESKSFDIVKAGGDKSRKGLSCPGIAHAAAYPIEIVFTQQKTVVWIRLVNTMFRMKMFFEDAGKIAFAKNMGMPGSIEDEIKDNIYRTFKDD